MPLLNIHRVAGRNDRLRSYRIVLNGDRVGKVKQGEVVTLGIEPGPHRLHLSIDGYASNPIPLYASTLREANVVCRSNPVSWLDRRKDDFAIQLYEDAADRSMCAFIYDMFLRHFATIESDDAPPQPATTKRPILSVGDFSILAQTATMDNPCNVGMMTVQGSSCHIFYIQLSVLGWAELREAKLLGPIRSFLYALTAAGLENVRRIGRTAANDFSAMQDEARRR